MKQSYIPLVCNMFPVCDSGTSLRYHNWMVELVDSTTMACISGTTLATAWNQYNNGLHVGYNTCNSMEPVPQWLPCRVQHVQQGGTNATMAYMSGITRATGWNKFHKGLHVGYNTCNRVEPVPQWLTCRVQHVHQGGTRTTMACNSKEPVPQ